jgi:hypothetical protein
VNDKLFIPQSVLDKWVENEKVVFNDNVLTLTSERKAYTLTPAVRFMKLLDGEDKASLLGRLRTLEKLTELGAEHMSDSVILGDTAYEVQEGFIAVVMVDEQVASQHELEEKTVQVQPPETTKVSPPPGLTQKAPSGAEPAVEITATPATETSSDADLLTKFLLNNLNF